MIIRGETPADHDAVDRVITAAFGQPAEAGLVRRLRDDGDAAISLVADVDGGVVAHVLLSPMTAPFPALALAPLSVLPQMQGSGIGSALVREALARAAGGPWRAVFVLGEPEYYERFGFRRELAAGFESPYAGGHFMALALGGDLPAASGVLRHAPAFRRLA